jgi:hypothetical protein
MICRGSGYPLGYIRTIGSAMALVSHVRPHVNFEMMHCRASYSNGLQAVQYEGMKWTLWDRWVLEGDLTVQQVLDWFAVSLAYMGTCKAACPLIA